MTLGPRLLKRAEGLNTVFNLFFYKHVATYSYYEMEFTSLMLAFDEYECQNPRDRIFTLATLAKDMVVRNVTVEWVHQALATEQSGDPTKDLRTWRSHETYVNYEATTADIYILFAYTLAINGKLGWMLGQAAARLSASTGGSASHPDLDLLPRWVPNWTVKYHRHAFWLEGNDVRWGPWYIWEIRLSGVHTKLRGDDVKERLADRFCYVLVAGAYMYSDKRLSSNLNSAAEELAELVQTIPTMAKSSHQQSHRKMLDMLVHPSQFWDDAEKKKDELLAPIIVKLLKDIIFNDPDFTVPGWNCLFQMVSITMEHRCVLTCDVDNPPADALPFDIVGIGPDHLELGDRVFSLPLRRRHFRDGEPFEHPITKEFFRDVAYAPLAFQNVWAATYLARPMGGVHVVHSQPVEDGAEAEHPKIFQFVGDCFLSTVRWLSPSRGLMPKAWLSYETEDSDEAACQKEFGDRYSDFDEDGEIYLC
ncbi:ankyrin and het domain protein [Colletotrichum asianum]